MSSTTQTTNYGLPIYQGTDRATWTDTNEGFTAIDTAIKAASDNASSASTTATALNGRVATVETSLANAEANIATLQASDTTQDTTLLAHTQAIANLEDEVDTIDTSSVTTHASINRNINVASGINGKVIRLHLSAEINDATFPSDGVIATLPTGVRPSTIGFNGVWFNQTGNIKYFTINTDGTVKLFGRTSTDTYVSFDCTYLN